MSDPAASALLVFVLAFAWMILAGVVQAVTGFALGPVALPMLVLLYGVKPSLVIILTLASLGALPVVWHGRAHLAPRALVPITLGTFAGAPVGVLVLAAADAQVLKLAIGVMTLLFAIPMFAGRRWRITRPTLVGTAAGAGSGLV